MVGRTGYPDPHALANNRSLTAAHPHRGRIFTRNDSTEPQRPPAAEIDSIVAAIDLKGRRQPPRATSQIQNLGTIAMLFHQLNSLQRLNRSNQYTARRPRRFAADIQHEMRSVIEEYIGVPRRKVHRLNTWGRATKMMACGIVWWVGFRFDDTPAHTAVRKFMHDGFPYEESGQCNRIAWQFRSSQAANTILCRGMCHSAT